MPKKQRAIASCISASGLAAGKPRAVTAVKSVGKPGRFPGLVRTQKHRAAVQWTSLFGFWSDSMTLWVQTQDVSGRKEFCHLRVAKHQACMSKSRTGQ